MYTMLENLGAKLQERVAELYISTNRKLKQCANRKLYQETQITNIPVDYGKKTFLQGVCSKWNELSKKLLSGGIQAEPICLLLEV